MASVSFRNVSKIFPGGVRALEGFDLEVDEGEFVVLVGPSGCGKSTTLRILAGLETPTAGSVRIGDRDVTHMNPRDRDIAMVFQSYALYPHMSVRDNLSFALRMRKTPGSEVSERVAHAADILSISPLLDRKPRELSGGQRQRVALGRAIVRDPAVFLFDEPLSNLDAKLRVQMRGELSLLHNRLGTTMLYVTHDQAEAMTLGDRIVVLEDGLVQQIAPPLELYNSPGNRFTAGFIGSPAMNFLPVRVEAGKILFPRGVGSEALPGVSDGEYDYGIRPEDVSFEPDSTVRGEVEVVEILGNEKIVILSVGDHSITARCAPSVDVSVGSEFPFSFDMQRAHLFDRSGERVVTGA